MSLNRKSPGSDKLGPTPMQRHLKEKRVKQETLPSGSNDVVFTESEITCIRMNLGHIGFPWLKRPKSMLELLDSHEALRKLANRETTPSAPDRSWVVEYMNEITTDLTFDEAHRMCEEKKEHVIMYRDSAYRYRRWTKTQTREVKDER